MNRFSIQSMDVAGLGKAPDVEFAIVDGAREIEAAPPGGRIRISAESADGATSRIVLTNAITGEVWADLMSAQVAVPSIAGEWSNAALYHSEIACALYWSMWRMQQLKSAVASAT